MRDLKADLELLEEHRKRIKDRIQWLKKQDSVDLEMIYCLRGDQAAITVCMAAIRSELVSGTQTSLTPS